MKMTFLRSTISLPNFVSCRVLQLSRSSSYCQPVLPSGSEVCPYGSFHTISMPHMVHSAPQSSFLQFSQCSMWSSIVQKGFPRFASTDSKSTSSEPPRFDFVPIYQFPYIIHLRLLSRMKIYQTIFMVLALPPSTYSYLYGSMNVLQYYCLCGTTIFAGLMLYITSYYFRRLIGLISFNRHTRQVRVSHLTFWGRRRDVFVPVEDVIPLTELSDRTDDVYIRFQRYEREGEELFFSVRYGRIVNDDLFRQVFGQHWDVHMRK